MDVKEVIEKHKATVFRKMQEHKHEIDRICNDIIDQLNNYKEYIIKPDHLFAGDVDTARCLRAYFDIVLQELVDDGFRITEDNGELRIEL
jgi:hypothetical protein